ncbi:MAG: hypothetical protein PHC41_13845 [Lachnospiraceae bacterium]|nr:hypothetical protein [Lachnospiraceae bacterium]MDD3617287.1 hypothetical protein [Lachnospiraceae bacterium]
MDEGGCWGCEEEVGGGRSGGKSRAVGTGLEEGGRLGAEIVGGVREGVELMWKGLEEKAGKKVFRLKIFTQCKEKKKLFLGGIGQERLSS